MLTSGLTYHLVSVCTHWSLEALITDGDVTQPIVLDSWKGTSKMKPCFAAVRQAGTKLSNTEMYEELAAARSVRVTPTSKTPSSQGRR